MRKRNKNIFIRVTEEELFIIKNYAKEAGSSLQEYMLSSSLSNHCLSKNVIEEIKSLRQNEVAIIHEIGININQLIKMSNIYETPPQVETLEKLALQLEFIRKEMNQLWQLQKQLINPLKQNKD